MVVELIKWLLQTLTLLAQAGVAIALFHIIFYRKGFFYEAYRENKDKLLWMAFAVALVATLGSLFYSEIVGWSPCKLCWYQRILMYPLVLILWIAAMRRDNKIGVYVLPMTVIGAVIAAFHYLQQVSVTFAQLSKGCAADGVDCSVRYTFSYGYITIPMMALTAFIIIGLLAYLKRKER
ncbi:disulfide bond formation protein B [Candidatus Woesearchaeota archaeon]|nr:disulfide bond formation protein B [Candidatus Woesearchaeota archaeon]